MQTIKEYKEYTAQLEGEVKKWHDAYDASQVHVRQLMEENKDIKDTIKRLQDSIIKKNSAQFVYDETIDRLMKFTDTKLEVKFMGEELSDIGTYQ